MIDYGKRIIKESYHEGKLQFTQVKYSIPMLIDNNEDQGKSDALSNIMEALDIITSGDTCELTLNIKADKKHVITMITKEFVVEE